MLCYVVDAQLFLQPKFVSSREHSVSVMKLLQPRRVPHKEHGVSLSLVGVV